MAALLLSGCTPQEQAYLPAASEEAKLTRAHFVAADGVELPLRSWLPKGKPQAVILALHGFNDYSRAFEMPGEYFRTRGIATYAYDQRGFGAAPHAGLWAGEENLLVDVRQCVLLLKERYPRTPLYLLGESMGGAVALAALADPSFPPVSGLVLSAPAAWNMGPLMRAPLWLFAHTFPFHTMTGEDLQIRASDNTAMLIALSHDPLIIKETRVDAIYGLAVLMQDAYDKAPQVRTRTLLLYGERDEVIPRQPVEETAHRFTAPLDIVYYPHGYHMLLRDLQRKKVMDDIVKWVLSSRGGRQ